MVDGPNMYNFCGGDPVNHVDPKGTETEEEKKRKLINPTPPKPKPKPPWLAARDQRADDLATKQRQDQAIAETMMEPLRGTVASPGTFVVDAQIGIKKEAKDIALTIHDARSQFLGTMVDYTVKDVTLREGVKYYLLIGEGDTSYQGVRRTDESMNGTSLGQSQVNALLDNGERAASTLLLAAGSPEFMGAMEAEVQGLRFASRGGVPKVGSGQLVVRQITRAEAEALTGLKPMPGGTIGGIEDYFVPSKVKFNSPQLKLPTSMKVGKGMTTPVDLSGIISEQRATHILIGDATGGGHLWPGMPTKTPFPKGWTPGQILEATADVATDPNLHWQQLTGPQGAKFTRSGKPVRFEVVGDRDGIKIKVVVEPDGEGVITSHPVQP